MNTILSTTNYDELSFLKGNRPINKAHLNNLIKSRIDASVIERLTLTFHTLEGKLVLQIKCPKSSERYYLEGQFYLRRAAETIRLDGKELVDYLNNQKTLLG